MRNQVAVKRLTRQYVETVSSSHSIQVKGASDSIHITMSNVTMVISQDVRTAKSTRAGRAKAKLENYPAAKLMFLYLTAGMAYTSLNWEKSAMTGILSMEMAAPSSAD